MLEVGISLICGVGVALLSIIDIPLGLGFAVMVISLENLLHERNSR